MRLIDADLLIERIKRNDDLPWNLDKIMQTAFESCVRHSPTAYDVDKVVERLEMQRKIAEKDKKESFEEWRHYWEGLMDAYEMAMEIVKKGGIE